MRRIKGINKNTPVSMFFSKQDSISDPKEGRSGRRRRLQPRIGIGGGPWRRGEGIAMPRIEGTRNGRKTG